MSDFFNTLPKSEEVIFEALDKSGHERRMSRIHAKLPEDIVATLVDNTAYSENQRLHMQDIGWTIVPATECKALGISEFIPSGTLLMVIRKEVKERLQRQAIAEAKSKVTGESFALNNVSDTKAIKHPDNGKAMPSVLVGGRSKA